jgi:LmbE family N-acetylglucosaminyl deacetylase
MSEITIERRVDARAGTELAASWAPILRSATPVHLPARRTIVVAPHPDDETLSSGGLIMRQIARRVPVTVVAVTDGEAAYPSWSAPGLAAARREEQATALSLLGVPAAATVRLGLPDSSVAAHQDDLAEHLDRLVEPGDVIVAPWRHDWHADHEACGRAAETVARANRCTLFGSLFWALHRVEPEDHPDARIAALSLTDDEAMWRRVALRSHASQFDGGRHRPILDDTLVERLLQPVEHYITPA